MAEEKKELVEQLCEVSFENEQLHSKNEQLEEEIKKLRITNANLRVRLEGYAKSHKSNGEEDYLPYQDDDYRD